MTQETEAEAQLRLNIRRLNEIGIALSKEREIPALVERVLMAAIELTKADGGSLYLVTRDNKLTFDIVLNRSLGIHWGGTTGTNVPLPDIALYHEDGSADYSSVVSACFHRGETINVSDVYETQAFDFLRTREFDRRNGYRSKALLSVPLLDHDQRIFAILQLINPVEPGDNGGEGILTVFDSQSCFLVESLASQASLALRNARLISGHRSLFESFITLIAQAIDDKSPFTGHHCRRVPELTMMLTKAAEHQAEGVFADFRLSPEQEYELRVASWLHDCGKIATPEWLIDKATKLETRFDRIMLVESRFEILRRDAEIELLRARIQRLMDDRRSPEKDEDNYSRRIEELRQRLDVVRRSNIGSEQMAEADSQAIDAMADDIWVDFDGNRQPLLTADEQRNLKIKKGTLTEEERTRCNEHIDITIRMLESLDYPPDLANVPEIAGSHHERIDGSGFPRGLTGEQMSVQARAMAIADVFESLTADDRPYKKAMTLSESLNILGEMKRAGHIDPDLFDLFISEGIYRKYAHAFLEPSRIDKVDLYQIPGTPYSNNADQPERFM